MQMRSVFSKTFVIWINLYSNWFAFKKQQNSRRKSSTTTKYVSVSCVFARENPSPGKTHMGKPKVASLQAPNTEVKIRNQKKVDFWAKNPHLRMISGGVSQVKCVKVEASHLCFLWLCFLWTLKVFSFSLWLWRKFWKMFCESVY